MNSSIDQVQLQFEASSLIVLNVILGLVMFGVALDLKVSDFGRILTQPRGVLTGVAAQLILLPALTFGLTRLFDPLPSIALGMILVACCPGGNISNFLTWLGKGDAGLSITITSCSTLLSAVLTPLSLTFWGSLHPSTAALLQSVELDIGQMLLTVFLLLGLPLGLGMLVAAQWPALAQKLQKPFKIISLLVFATFIAGALGKNWEPFLDNVHKIFLLVLVHNALAFGTGYLSARLTGLSIPERRAVTMEVGIQNSGLGLILIFTFFGGLGGMAIIAAWWGVWHIIAGLSLVTLWTRLTPKAS